MNLYCHLPFGKLHRGNPDVIRLAGAIGRTASSVAMKLCNLASLDPRLQQRGVKGLSGASEADREIWNEFHGDWERLAIQSEELREQYGLPDDSATADEVVPEIRRFVGATEGSRVTKVRLAQRFFRSSVLASYASRCCITDINQPAFLIASHILPWSQYPQHRTDPRNGICLSSLHDRAFDRGLITFDENLRMVISAKLRSGLLNHVLNESFSRFEGKELRLPDKFCPEQSFLAVHRDQIFVQ
ncbi:MAG: putative restriction endonuclease [Planctomycetaceae bacterium]|nr:putative restriction endonuclease [Planctomycetaceae bacterium]